MATYGPVCKFDTADVGFDVGVFDKSMLIDSESFTTADVIATSGAKGLAEILNIVDGMVVKLTLSEALHIIDSITKSVTKSVSESLGIADVFTKTVTKLLSESLGIGDTISLDGTKSLSESFSIIDTIKFKVFFGEVLHIADTLLKSATKLLSESFSFIDIVKLIEPFKIFFSESLHIVDSVSLKSILKFSEAIKIVDSVFRNIYMLIRKISIRVRGGSYESDIELEEKKEE